jgi:RNA polymerase sigma factor (sigma-70 family)
VPETTGPDPALNGTAEVVGALRGLTPAQRASVYLHYQADLPVRQVAHLTGMSVASVKVHLMRGRRRLRELLGDEDEA